MTNLIEGEDFYYNEEGQIVLTINFHLKKDFAVAMGAGIVLTIMKKYPNRNVLNCYL